MNYEKLSIIRAASKKHAFAAAFAAFALLTGCSSTSTHQATSVVGYLYPKQSEPIDKPGVPVLRLPLKVGVAFVPEGDDDNRFTRSGPLSESQRVALIDKVSASFKKLPFVKSVEVIPSAYLTPNGGFANLQQLQSMFGVDVIALISYDQVQFTDEGLLSLTYWTVVGAYVVQGEKNDTQTMLDAVVYDIKSRKLLLRAPGTSRVKHSSTPVNLSEALRHDREKGFEIAATNMEDNLHRELELFHERVKKTPNEIRIVRPPGYQGGGSLSGLEVMVAGGIGALWWGRRRIRRG